MFNTLTVILLEKTREIGFMKAIGVETKAIRLLFLTESMLLSFFGGIAGLILAVVAGKLLNFAVNVYAVRTGSSTVQFFTTPPALVVSMILLMAVIGLIVGIFPALRAARIKPLDALRYE
jgi:putative ABC transport system permease protein